MKRLAMILITVFVTSLAHAEPIILEETATKQWPGDYPKTMQAFEYARERSPDFLGYIDIGLMRYYAELYSMEVLDKGAPPTDQHRRAAMEAGIKYALEEKARDERINAQYAELQARVADLTNQLRESQSRVVSLAYALNARRPGSGVVATDAWRQNNAHWPGPRPTPAQLEAGREQQAKNESILRLNHEMERNRQQHAQERIADELRFLREQQQSNHREEMRQREDESMDRMLKRDY